MATFANALMNTLMGMGTVFIVLIFISLIISLFAYIPQIEEKMKGGNKKEVAKAAPAPVAPVIDEEEEDEEELVNDDALVAVIMAAIIASQGNNATSADKLVVRSIRRARGRR